MLRLPLADAPPPHVLHRRLAARHATTFILESRDGPKRLARYSILGFAPAATVRLDADGLHVEGDAPKPSPDEDPRDYLRRLHALHRAAEAGPFVGGLVGSIGYDFARTLEPSLDTGKAEAWPRLEWGLYLDGIVVDHQAGTTTYISRGPDRSAEVAEALAAADEEPVLRVKALTSPIGPEDFQRRVRVAQEAIRQGEAFQIVVSRPYQAAYEGDLGAVYAALRALAPVPYLFHLRHGGRELLGASPEMLVRVRGGVAETFPIAGTRPLTGDTARDDAAAAQLSADRKENAEHAMLVDLARNDLGRVCRPGTVRVHALAQVHAFGKVQHLVSHVEGRLADGRDALDALCAVFPAGTVSGAPKVRAMEHIDGIETSPRGPYAGAVAYWSFSGAFDSAIAIRSLSAQQGRLTVQAGAGIVHRSDPEAEFRETEHKTAALREALGRFA